jgi:hypothetical protein
MKKLYVTTVTTTLLGLALATTAVAQQQLQEDLTDARTPTTSCDDVNWNKDMLSKHASLIKACQEVIDVEGESWARFAANFVRVEPNGDVIFSVRDKNDRAVEEVTLDPVPGQLAYIDGRATAFSTLRDTDSISLYVPEGQYGFATRPGATREQLAKVVVPSDATRSTAGTPAATTTTTDRTTATDSTTANERMLAQRDTNREVLPTTAGPLPWLALVGLLSLLGGLGLTLRRWF